MQLENGWIVGVTRVVSPHCDRRPDDEPPSLLVIHNISLPPGEFGGPYIDQLFTGTLDPAQHPYFAEIHQLRVSAHCLIRRDGEIVQYVPFDQRAWHAGVSLYQGAIGATISPSASSWKAPTCCLTPRRNTARCRRSPRCWPNIIRRWWPISPGIAISPPAARPIPGRRSIGIAIWHLWNNATRPPTLCLRQEKGRGIANDAVYAVAGFGLGAPV